VLIAEKIRRLGNNLEPRKQGDGTEKSTSCKSKFVMLRFEVPDGVGVTSSARRWIDLLARARLRDRTFDRDPGAGRAETHGTTNMYRGSGRASRRRRTLGAKKRPARRSTEAEQLSVFRRRAFDASRRRRPQRPAAPTPDAARDSRSRSSRRTTTSGRAPGRSTRGGKARLSSPDERPVLVVDTSALSTATAREPVE